MSQTRVNALGLSGNNSKYDTIKAIIEIDLSIQASASPINSNVFLNLTISSKARLVSN